MARAGTSLRGHAPSRAAHGRESDGAGRFAQGGPPPAPTARWGEQSATGLQPEPRRRRLASPQLVRPNDHLQPRSSLGWCCTCSAGNSCGSLLVSLTHRQGRCAPAQPCCPSRLGGRWWPAGKSLGIRCRRRRAYNPSRSQHWQRTSAPARREAGTVAAVSSWRGVMVRHACTACPPGDPLAAGAWTDHGNGAAMRPGIIRDGRFMASGNRRRKRVGTMPAQVAAIVRPVPG